MSVIWPNHHGLFARVRRVDRTLLWLNLGLLLCSMFVPFTTAVLADALRDGNANDLRAAAVLYAVVAALQSPLGSPCSRTFATIESWSIPRSTRRRFT